MKLLFMILLLHLFADYTLQGILADLKQKGWWKKQCEKYGVDFHKYRYDYICGIICHSLYWTLVTFAPLIFFKDMSDVHIAVIVIGNTAFHAIVDHIKANKFSINLIVDQALHLVQIAATVIILQ